MCHIKLNSAPPILTHLQHIIYRHIYYQVKSSIMKILQNQSESFYLNFLWEVDYFVLICNIVIFYTHQQKQRCLGVAAMVKACSYVVFQKMFCIIQTFAATVFATEIKKFKWTQIKFNMLMKSINIKSSKSKSLDL